LRLFLLLSLAAAALAALAASFAARMVSMGSRRGLSWGWVKD